MARMMYLVATMMAVVAMVTPSSAVLFAKKAQPDSLPRRLPPICRPPPSVKGIDEGVRSEEELGRVREPQLSVETLKKLDASAAKEFLEFANSSIDTLYQPETRRRENLAFVELCKAKWTLKSHGWVIARYYVHSCNCWRYIKAFAPVKVWHRECSPQGQKCRVVNGCCRQKYTWVGMPVWVRYPVCGGYRYKIQWSYIRVGACCECMANVTTNFNCQCKK